MDNGHEIRWVKSIGAFGANQLFRIEGGEVMEAFRWNPCFVTGLADVDDQHHHLVDVINRFSNLVVRDEDVSVAEMETLLAELTAYTRYHFTEEEALMASTGLDPRYIEQHRIAHASFLDEVMAIPASLAANNRDSAKSLLQFLIHWLAYHILGMDQAMARQIASIARGGQPESAYLAEATGAHAEDSSTNALLTALNGMFELVSDRNRKLVQLNKTLEERVAERTRALTDANWRLDELANTDMLTGLPNRRYALLSLASEWQASTDAGTPLACMMIDADGFKGINDRYGHDAGDGVLRALSKQLRNAVRTDDVVCRLGGDEFLIICPRTPLDGALTLAETVRREVAALRVPAGAGEWRGSISVGVAGRTAPMTNLEDLIKAADMGVYAAKRNGRNCVATADR